MTLYHAVTDAKAATETVKNTALSHFFELVKTSKGNSKWMILRCSRWGQYDGRGNGTCNQSTIKTNCKYRVIIRHSDRTKLWRITHDNDTHNHNVNVEDLAGLIDARKFSPSQEEELKNMWIAGCFPRQ